MYIVHRQCKIKVFQNLHFSQKCFQSAAAGIFKKNLHCHYTKYTNKHELGPLFLSSFRKWISAFKLSNSYKGRVRTYLGKKHLLKNNCMEFLTSTIQHIHYIYLFNIVISYIIWQVFVLVSYRVTLWHENQ